MNTDWQPSTFEDRLLHAYLQDHPGRLFMEVRVGGTEQSHYARRIDWVLVPGYEAVVHPPHQYSSDDLRDAADQARVHVIEAKRTLNRNVIGQVLAGETLFNRAFDPAATQLVALCDSGEKDLEWVCDQHGIDVAIHPVSPEEREEAQPTDADECIQRKDIRKEPNAGRRGAFLWGWNDAADGHLYRTVLRKKTHANMGNLFGWIYGDASDEFRIATWKRYTDRLALTNESD